MLSLVYVRRETSKEMETLRFERKQLVLHWKSSLVGLTRRDEALASAVEALREAEVSAKDYDMEIEGLKRELHKQQTRWVGRDGRTDGEGGVGVRGCSCMHAAVGRSVGAVR